MCFCFCFINEESLRPKDLDLYIYTDIVPDVPDTSGESKNNIGAAFGGPKTFILNGSNKGFSQEFVVPEPSAFSTPTMIFLLREKKDKYLLSKAVRIEIVAILVHLMMIRTRFPKSEDYNFVCQKLVERYPQLQDGIGNGYVGILFAAKQFVETAHA